MVGFERGTVSAIAPNTMSDDHLWYAQLSARGYRPGLSLATLLELFLSMGRRERSSLCSALHFANQQLLLDVQHDPDAFAHAILSSTDTHSLSLAHPDNTMAVELSILAFAARLLRHEQPPSWALLDTYLGKLVRELGRQLQRPEAGTLGWWIHANARGAPLEHAIAELVLAHEVRAWPTASRCQPLVELLDHGRRNDTLPSSLHTETLVTTRVLRVLNTGGVGGLFGTYMLSATESTGLWCRGRGPGRRGPMHQFEADVARPILRSRGRRIEHHQRSNRRPLHVARRRAITTHFWLARADCGHDCEAQLRELDALLIH